MHRWPIVHSHGMECTVDSNVLEKASGKGKCQDQIHSIVNHESGGGLASNQGR